MTKQDFLDLFQPAAENLWARINETQKQEIEEAVQEKTRHHITELADRDRKVQEAEAKAAERLTAKEALEKKVNEERQAINKELQELRKAAAEAAEEKAKLVREHQSEKAKLERDLADARAQKSALEEIKALILKPGDSPVPAVPVADVPKKP